VVEEEGMKPEEKRLGRLLATEKFGRDELAWLLTQPIPDDLKQVITYMLAQLDSLTARLTGFTQ
jgi:hypothetical protein